MSLPFYWKIALLFHMVYFDNFYTSGPLVDMLDKDEICLGYCPQSGIYRNLDTWGMLYIITEGAARGDYSTSRMVSKLR